MTTTRSILPLVSMALPLVLFTASCTETTSQGRPCDPALTGTWGDGQVDETALKFHGTEFEWTFDGDLQQRGVCDTEDGILTITVQNNYGSPQRLLGDYSSPYSISGDTLSWAGGTFAKK